MSGLGSDAALYSRIRDYAEIVDDVLIRIKSGGVFSQDERVQQLGTLLASLGDSRQRTGASTLLGAVLRHAATSQVSWSQLGKELLAGQTTPSLIHQLEVLATVIEHERAGVLAKMRGT